MFALQNPKSESTLLDDLALVCPACGGELIGEDEGRACLGCARAFPAVAGLDDLRLESDRYLSLEAERAKAERLAMAGQTTDVRGLSEAYYAMTDDVVDARRDRFLRHIASAEARGEALAARLPEGARILEVGCGTGGFLVAALRSGRSVVGVDIASRWLVVARRRLADHGLSTTLVAASADRLPWADGQFDVVVADSLLEHLDDPSAALREWARVLKPGGQVLSWSPNRYTLTTDPHVGLWGVGWLPRAWVPGYLRLRGKDSWPPRTLSAGEVRRLARASGLDAVGVDVPEVPEGWSRALSPVYRAAAGAYASARAFPPTRTVLRAIGPLWELRATRRGAA